MLTWFHAELPWWVFLPLGTWLSCWHGSLQHEALHGHPTPWTAVNTAIAFPPLSLWLPYPIYRDSHLRHHATNSLTCPIDDPESYYVTPARWAAMPRWRRALLRFNNTLAGRLLVGPAISLVAFARGELARLRGGDADAAAVWTRHLLACIPVVLWVNVVCGIPLWAYAVMFAYPGLSLTMLRSFYEHRPAPIADQRTAIVEASWPMRLLYLNNNFHALHHASPGMAWYALPRAYQENRSAILGRNGRFFFHGYAEQVRRYLWRIKDEPVHAPLAR
jgi:fatty acid desaturase